MKIRTLCLDDIMNVNCYIVTDEESGKSLVIDPGAWETKLEEAINEAGAANIEYILLTHTHFDHIGAVDAVVRATGAKLAVPEFEQRNLSSPALNASSMVGRRCVVESEPDILVTGDTKIKLGSLEFRAVRTPGHSQGSTCYFCGDVIFTGDTLFKSSIGRTDLPGGNRRQMMASLARLATLGKNYTLYPGHGEATTLFEELENNVYFVEYYHEYLRRTESFY